MQGALRRIQSRSGSGHNVWTMGEGHIPKRELPAFSGQLLALALLCTHRADSWTKVSQYVMRT